MKKPIESGQKDVRMFYGFSIVLSSLIGVSAAYLYQNKLQNTLSDTLEFGIVVLVVMEILIWCRRRDMIDIAELKDITKLEVCIPNPILAIRAALSREAREIESIAAVAVIGVIGYMLCNIFLTEMWISQKIAALELESGKHNDDYIKKTQDLRATSS